MQQLTFPFFNEKNIEEPWIQTYSGKKFILSNPDPDSIVIEDIAHALSNICRFTGHSNRFYSVAQHCVLVSHFCNNQNRLYGLLHDASECYLSDIASPIKRSIDFSKYREIENKLQKSIYKKFGLDEKEPEDIKQADLTLLSTEARDFMNPRKDWIGLVNPLPCNITPMSPFEAKRSFLSRFKELTLI
jgi:hypothetical protein